MDEPKCVAETLAWCNERRAEKYQEPLDVLPRGSRYQGSSCPCGKATGLHVTSDYYGSDVEDAMESSRVLPAPVRKFVRLFDAGSLPQYDQDVNY